MIPLRLQLANFMSYGEGVPALHLADVKLACLSGDNGNGKSALLDAITWALFGETRARVEDDVIRLGAKSAGVIFEFEVAGNFYRIDKRRDRSRGASWEFQIRQDDGGFRSLSGTNGRETKERIQSVLRMDYKTFLTTSYLKQGEADAFARATAGDRKETLARILDLSRYDALEALARERGREATQQETDADRALVEIDADLGRDDEVKLALADAEARLAVGQSGIDDAQRDYETALARAQSLETELSRVEELREKIKDNEDSLARERYEEAEREKRLREAERVLSRKIEWEAALLRRGEIERELTPLEARWSQGINLQSEILQLDSQLNNARREREQTLASLDRELALLRRDEERADMLTRQLATEQANRPDSEATTAALESASATLRAWETRVAELKAENAAKKSERAKLERRHQALEEGTSADCDWCGQPLTSEGRRQAILETQALLAALDEAQATLVAEGREARTSLDDSRSAHEKARAEADRLQQATAESARLTTELLPLKGVAAQIASVGRERDAQAVELDQARFLPEERKRRTTLAAELDSLETVGRERVRLHGERDALQGLDREIERLRIAEEVALAEPERLVALKASVEDRRKRIEKARGIVAGLESKLRDLDALRRERDDSGRRLTEARTSLQSAERSVGQLTGERDRLEKRKSERKSWVERREEAVREKDTYRELTAAFGKRGVQALIIENALPEIEEEANRLLSRMTQGSLQVRLRTTRDAKTKGGGPIETLDIILFDDVGERPFELYSGGEAFRVSLALRVALSRTLAKRAGAPLQTLILDEGFGTQDPRGREAIAEALHSVSEDFALVLVITHIDDLKESFPTRIEVTKGENGSTFTVQ